MNVFNWAERKARTFKWYHYSLLKTGMMVFGILLVKLFPELIETDTRILLLVFLATIIPVGVRFYAPKQVER